MTVPPFDSGLPLAERTLLRQGAIKKLDDIVSKRVGGFAAAVIGFPYVMHDYADDSKEVGLLFDLLNGASPAYAVAIGDMKSTRTGGQGGNKGEFEMHVYCISTNMRGTDGRLEPDARSALVAGIDPGIDAMLVLARMILTDVRLPSLGNKMDVFRFDGEHHLDTAREETIWAARFSVVVSLNTDIARGITNTINALNAAYYPGTYLEPPAIDPVLETLTVARTNP